MLIGLTTVAVLVTLACHCGDALDNGVARTPPMGWMSWERFECNTNCDTDPDNCISEKLLMQMADVMAAEGYKDAGYEYVAIDDCWLANERDKDGKLQPEPKRFPSGMKALADYMHNLGLKLGIYEDIGSKTCAGFPGSRGHMRDDANTFAQWGVDMLKFDGCGGNVQLYEEGYPEMSRYLNESGRHIVFSCEWPMYESAQGGKPDYVKIAKYCNMFRDLTDIYDSWGSVLGMIDYFGDDPGNFSAVAAPGAWNDPDQVVIGNFGLSHDQERAQMALWAIMASPVLVSADLRKMRASSKAILLNKYVIAVNQDPLGVQGRRVKQMGSLSAWTKPVLPTGSYAIVVLNAGTGGYPSKVTFSLADLGIDHGKYSIAEVFEQTKMGSFKPNDTLSCFVNPTGVFLMRATIL